MEPETRDVGAGILFQRGPRERQEREQKVYVLGGRKPIQGVLMSPGPWCLWDPTELSLQNTGS